MTVVYQMTQLMDVLKIMIQVMAMVMVVLLKSVKKDIVQKVHIGMVVFAMTVATV